MATDISQVQAQRFKESESKRMNAEIKSHQDQHNREYGKIVKTNEATITDLRKDYDNKVDSMKAELEQRLTEIRRKNEELINGENQRMTAELENLKSAHKDQIQEVKTAQQNQIDDMNLSHRNTVENARQKFLKEKLKWET